MRQRWLITGVFPAFNSVCDWVAKLIKTNRVESVKRFDANSLFVTRDPMHLELGNLDRGRRADPFYPANVYDVNAMRTHGRCC